MKSTCKAFFRVVFSLCFMSLLLLCGRAVLSEGERVSIQISEVCAGCSALTVTDLDGDTPDWIEIYNPGDTAIDLRGYSLTKDLSDSERYILPGIELEPKAYIVVFCSGKTVHDDRELHAPFKLSAAGDRIYLYQEQKLIDAVTFGQQERDTSLIRAEDQAFQVTYKPTPGKINILQEEPVEIEDVVGLITINEIMVSAAPYYKTYGFDWVELKNPSLHPVNMHGWRIVLNSETSYTFEDTVIPCSEYLKVYMEDQFLYNVINTGYTLPASGGVLELFDADDQLVSRVHWTKRMPGNIAYGLPADQGDTYRFLAKDSFGYVNTAEAYDDQTAEVMFSIAGGYHDEPVQVELTCEENAVIYYTLDGSEPDRKKGKVYTGPITITDTTVLRAAAKHPDKLYSQSRAETYLYGFNGDFPIVSVISDPDHLYDTDRGIMVRGNGVIENYKQDWQYPANVEYYDPDGTCLLNQLASLAIAGEVSRNKGQKSFVLFARAAYGNAYFDFDPFPNREYDQIKSFVLRNSGSEGVLDGIRFNDALLTGLAIRHSACMASDSRPVLVLLNGKVFGHMNIRERMNKFTIAAHEEVPNSLINEIDILTDNGTVMQGSADDYLALSAFMKTNDLNDPDALSYVESQMDIETYFDSIIWQMITGNQDLSNTRWYRVPGGKWKWMIYDLDTAMSGEGEQTFSYYFKDIQKTNIVPFDHVPFGALMKVPAMKDRFLKRFA